MKKFISLSKSGSQSGSHRVVTLASTVGSPSAHRRGTMLKPLFLAMLFLIAGIGNVWADYTVTFKTASSDGSTCNTTVSNYVTETTYIASMTASKAYYNGRSGMKLGSSSATGNAEFTLSTAGQIKASNISVTSTAYDSNKNYKCTVTYTDNTTTIKTSQAFGSNLSLDLESTKTISKIKFESLTSNSGRGYIGSFTITAASGVSQNPTVSASPEAVNNVVAAGVNNQSISLSYENISGYTTVVSVHPNADGTGTLSPAWLSASISSPYSTVSYTVSANSSAARTAYIKVRATASGNKEATTIIPVSQVKYTEPTGTFVKYTGEITEGDYVIYGSSTHSYAMKNTITSSRFDPVSITPEDDEISNPDESLVWHIAPSATAGYWTIYSEDVSKYAGGSTTNNQATLLDASSSDYAKWSISISNGVATISNKGRGSDRHLLQINNDNNKWGLFTSGNTNPTLYKKALPTHAVTFTAAPTGGTVTVSAGSAINSGAQVEEGTTVTVTPTPSQYYRLVSVTKGGQAITPVQGVYSFTMPTSDVAIAVTFEYISVTAVTLNKSATSLVVGATETLSVSSVTPNTALNTVTWSSTDETVATVDSETGQVTAVAAGSATIKATSTVSTSVFGSCALTVTAATGNPVTITQTTGGTVTANEDVSDVLAGTSVTLTATPAAGYSFSGWTVLDDNADEITPTAQTANTFTFSMPDGEVTAEASFTHEEAVLKLHDADGESTFDSENTHYWKESVTLPTSAATCSKTFVGWSADENRATAPELAKGASYTIPNKGANNDLYAVYATISGGGTSTTNIAYTNTETTTNMGAETNEAEKFNLDADEWSVIGASGSASNNVGLNKAQEIRLYGHASGGNTLTITAPQTVTSIALTMTANKDNARVKVGGQTVTISDGVYPIGATTFVIENANTDNTQVVITNIAVNFTSDPIYSDYSTTCLPKSTTPVLTDGGTFTAATSVEILAEDGATIYYTTDGSDPKTSGTKQTYSTEIELSERGTYTIKAYAVEAGKEASDVASETYNINLPFTVADAIAIIPNNNDERADTYIDGIVCTAGTSVSSGAMTYYISDNGSADGAKIRIYSGKGLNNEYFSATTDLKVGDKVRVFGKLNNYNGSYDVDNSYLTSLEVASVSSVAISGTASKTVYSSEDNIFSFAGLTATATYSTGYVKDVTNEDGVWSTNLSENTVTEGGNVNVTATFGGQTSDAVVVAVTYTSKTVASISLSYNAISTYVGHDFLKPTVTAHYVEEIADEDVTEGATFGEAAYNKNTAGKYTIAVSYQGAEASYDITVKAIANEKATAYTAVEINDIIANAYKSTTASTYDVYVKGIVVENAYNTSGNSVYHISADGTSTNQFYIYGAKYFDTETSATGNVKAGDDVIVKGKIQNYNSNTPELKSSTVVYQLREGALTVNNVAEFEVGQPDLAEANLTINRHGSTGAITFSCAENDALEIVENKLRAKGEATADVTVTATMAADNTEGQINFTEASTTFTVHVVPAQVRYAVTFDLNGGSAEPMPSLGNQLENADVEIPAGTFTKDGYKFNGWVVTYVDANEQVQNVTVTKTGDVYSFKMPAAAVTVTAQWVEGSDFTWDAVGSSYSDGAELSGTVATDNKVSIVLSAGTNNNPPKWYNNGNAARIYQNNTVTISAIEGKLISAITFNFTSGNTNTCGDKLTIDGTVGTWSGLANEIVFTPSAAMRVTSITVTYINGTVTTLSIANIAMKKTDAATAIVPVCNVDPTPAIAYSGYDTELITIENGTVAPTGTKTGNTTVTAIIAQGSNYTGKETTFTVAVADKTIPEMSFPQAEYNANLGESFTAPTLTKPEGVSVAYSSDNAAVSVDENTGAITINAEGTAVITATSVENEDYSVGTASYTLNVIDPNKDVLTVSAIAAGSSYADWSNKEFGSTVKYAGNSMTASGDHAGAIQMRNTNPSGIVTTSAIGYLKSISAAETTNGNNSLEIYAKGTAYESSADLYSSDEAVKGVKIGTIGKDGDAMVFVDGKAYSDNYKYIGIKPVGGAVYYDDITITWTPAEFASFAVTYKAGEATGDDVVENIEEGSIISLKAADTFTAPEGKIFAGWLLTGEENARAAGSKFTVTAAATFTAQWISVYTITYLPGEAAGDPVVVENVPIGNYKLAENTFTAPESKEFAGWKLNNEGDVLAANSDFEVTANAEFTAQWSIVKQQAGLAYTTTSYMITRGRSFEAPELTNPNGLIVAYSGNNDEVATVDAATGAITLKGGIGTVTVTATSAETDYYYAGEASYTLKVKDANLSGGWVRLTNANTLVAGMKVIVAQYVSSQNGTIKTMGGQNTNNRAEVAGTLQNDTLISDEGTEILTLVAIKNTTNFALKTADNKYLYAAGSGSGKNYLKSKAKVDGDATWAISLSADGKATITAQGDNTNNKMQYNQSNTLFSCYASTSQKEIALYSKTIAVSEGDVNASTLEEYADVVVAGDATLVINEGTKPLGNITGNVTVNAPLQAEGVHLGVNNTMEVNSTVNVPSFSISVQLGSTGQATNVNVDVEHGGSIAAPEGYVDMELSDGANPDHWHSFTVPFEVDALNGIYDAETGDKLANEENYAIMDYHGDIRAQGKYGWKKYRGTLKPGVFYLITVDGASKVLRFMKKAGSSYVAPNYMAMKYYGDNNPENTNNGWCGVGNQNMFGGYVPFKAQILNSDGTGYDAYNANTTKFSACIPFFIQIESDDNLAVSTTLPSSVAARRVAAKGINDIKVTFGNENYSDKLYISANEDAKNAYEVGKDLVKMTMSNTPVIPQIFGKAYGNKLCMVYAPMSNDQAVYDLSLYAPANGEYTIAAPEVENADLYLTKDGAIIWNLTMSEYPISLNKGTTEGYGLLLKAKAPQTPTGVEQSEVNHQPSDIQKIIINDNVFILRGGKMYDVTGKAVK